MKQIIDLHIHTNCSDGALSPKEVIDMANKNGVTVISITDHDTIEAYDDDIFHYAENFGIKLINGVEISTKINKAGIHVLGYDFDIKNKALNEKLLKLRNARHDYLYNVALKLKELGYVLDTDKLDKIDAVTKAHIALDVVNNHDNEKILISTFHHIPSKGEFIETIMNEGCPAYVKKETITPKEAADLIRKAGGKVILAHPVAYQYEDNLSDKDIFTLIKDMDVDGIEANYIYIDRNNHKINDCDKWNKITDEYHLIATIGSDFHNKDGIHPEIGLVHEEMNLNDTTIDNIIHYLLS